MPRSSSCLVLALVLAGCKPGVVGNPTLTAPAGNAVITIKGAVLDAAGKPLANAKAQVVRYGGGGKSLDAQFVEGGDAVDLDAQGAFTLKKKGQDVAGDGGTARYHLQVDRPDGSQARVAFYPSKATTEIPPLRLWDVAAAVSATTGAVDLAIQPPKGGKAGVLRVHRGESLHWEQDGEGAKALPAYLFEPGVAYRVQVEAAIGETHTFRSANHAFTASEIGRSRILPVAAATDEAGAAVTGWHDGTITYQAPDAAASGQAVLDLLVGPKAKDVVYDLGASKVVDRVVIYGSLGLTRVVVGDNPDGTGGKAVTPTTKLWQDLAIGASGRYVRLERPTREGVFTQNEVRVIGPATP